MIYTEQTKKALKLCFKAHKNQTDKSGMPYVFHPFHLAEQMTDELTTIVALLHDVAEDNKKYPLKKLRKMGFPSEVIEALTLLTHKKTVPYMEYVARIKQTPISTAVKLADLRHNSDLTRLDNPSDKDLARVEKYRKAIRLLEEIDA